ncbi:MAG TPA: glycosyltransferase [Tepidisphaeraceae bacterium]|nr:glycosyltransferase [Tepidisphaeraceae bacterium]
MSTTLATDPPLRILYVGQLDAGGTCLQRFNALRELGHHLEGIELFPPDMLRANSRLWQRARRKLFGIGPTDLCNVNGQILDAMRLRSFDLLWLDKALTIRRSTFENVKQISPGTTIVGYSPDDMGSWPYQSRDFLRHLPLYDIYFTTKSYGVRDLQALGCPRVVFVPNAFDPAVHRPIPLTPEDREQFGGPVGFIGDYEAERANMMTMLAENGISIRIWGPNWNRLKTVHPNIRIEGKSVWSDDYAKAICSFDINLGFLRKMGRDRQTTRSIEIPACGAFMLAERTEEHLGLFREGIEAEFFDSAEELLKKVKYFLANSAARQTIAAAGRQRCLDSRYSNHGRLRTAIQEVVHLRK